MYIISSLTSAKIGTGRASMLIKPSAQHRFRQSACLPVNTAKLSVRWPTTSKSEPTSSASRVELALRPLQ